MTNSVTANLDTGDLDEQYAYKIANRHQTDGMSALRISQMEDIPYSYQTIINHLRQMGVYDRDISLANKGGVR